MVPVRSCGQICGNRLFAKGSAGGSTRRPVSRVLSVWPGSRRVARGSHSSGTRLAARLTRPTRAAGRECPCGPRTDRCHPYSVLLPVGFTLPPLLPGARCALTAPFRPCLRGRVRSRGPPCAGGLFSVALSLGSPPPAVNRHRIPVEPGLSSISGANPGNSGCPAVWRAHRCAAHTPASSCETGPTAGEPLVIGCLRRVGPTDLTLRTLSSRP